MAGTGLQSRPRRALVVVASSGLFALLFAALLLWAYVSAVKILGQADWPFARPGTTAQGPYLRVIRSQQELIQASGAPGDGKTQIMLERFLTKAFQVKTVNFNRHMLLVVGGGVQRTGGYRVEVTGVEFDKDHNALRVRWKLHSPEPGQPVAQRSTSPATLVLLKRLDGDVRLELVQETDQGSEAEGDE